MNTNNEKQLKSEGEGDVSSNDVPDSAILNDSKDLDQAFHYLQNARPNPESGTDLEALRRKIDWRIVPVMFCAYTMQFIDKVLLNVSPGFGRPSLRCC